jgi:hypothetical protein
MSLTSATYLYNDRCPIFTLYITGVLLLIILNKYANLEYNEAISETSNSDVLL